MSQTRLPPIVRDIFDKVGLPGLALGVGCCTAAVALGLILRRSRAGLKVTNAETAPESVPLVLSQYENQIFKDLLRGSDVATGAFIAGV